MSKFWDNSGPNRGPVPIKKIKIVLRLHQAKPFEHETSWNSDGKFCNSL